MIIKYTDDKKHAIIALDVVRGGVIHKVYSFILNTCSGFINVCLFLKFVVILYAYLPGDRKSIHSRQELCYSVGPRISRSQ